MRASGPFLHGRPVVPAQGALSGGPSTVRLAGRARQVLAGDRGVVTTPPTPVPEPAAARAAARPPSGPWRDAFLAVLGLVLPVTCVGCGTPDRALCRACRADLDARPLRRRLVAGVRLDAAFAYEGLVRTLVLELKLRSRTDLAPALAPRFGDLVRQALADAPGALLVRVPPSRTGARRRGFDPVVLLLRRSSVPRRSVGPWTVPLWSAARGSAHRGSAHRGPAHRRSVLGGSSSSPPPAGAVRARGATLRRVRPPRTARATAHGQKERSAIERVEATVGTLRADGVRGRAVVVVDDVVTTGVTMAEAVRAVRAAGGHVVRCVALAEVEE